jgi:hypothetical protein
MAEGADADWTMDQVLAQIRSENWALYGLLGAADEVIGAGVVAVKTTGRRRILEVILFGAGDHSVAWPESINELKTLATRLGCSVIQGQGRPGWHRWLGAKSLNTFELEI